MQKYLFQKDNRRYIVSRMQELTGERMVYTRLPRCAYMLRGIVLEKDGTVSLEASADRELMEKLISEGLIWLDAPLEPDFSRYDELIETTPVPPPGEKPEIRFPLSEHSAASLQNLAFSLYSKGSLISKATGGHFEVSEELMETLYSCYRIHLQDVLDILRDAEGSDLIGLRLDENDVIFNGFRETNDPAERQAWTDLAARMNSVAISQNHIRARRTDETNEKFIFRSWLTRLGMNGPEYKETRKILCRNLEGSTAFKTKAQEERWKHRRMQEKQARKAETDLV